MAKGNRTEETSSNNPNNGCVKMKKTRKSSPRDSPSQRSSIYRGVTRHRWTGRYEAHLWDKNCWNESQSKKGRQVYLGAYIDENAAARAYDLAALKYWGQETLLNFPLPTYQQEFKDMQGQSKEEYIGSLRRKSSGFSRGVSKYRGVARHHHNGRWEARIGRVFGNKYLYLGTYATQEEAAIAYDMAAIEYRGINAVTNFDLSRYIKCPFQNQKDNKASNTSNPNLKDPSSAMASNYVPELTLNHPSSSASSSSSSSSSASHANANELGLLLQSSKMKGKQTPRCSFPDDIQTFFEGHDNGGLVEGDGTLFGDLNAFEPPVFQCELELL